MLSVLLLLSALEGTVVAQEAPGQGAPEAPPQEVQSAEAARAVADAFRAMVSEADSGDWQGADAAFNAALDAVDLHRGPLESALGEPAVRTFQFIDQRIPEIVAALDAEDGPALRVAVRLIERELALMTGGAAERPESEGEAGQVLLQWRAAHDAILALAEAGLWRDMRNASTDLSKDIARRGPLVVKAADTDVQGTVDLARVFAMRLRAAALDQSIVDARTAGAVFEDALNTLSMAVGLSPTPTAAAPAGSKLRFRGFEVAGEPGEVISMPIAAEGIPQIGMGGMELAAHWSPRSLRLVDAAWEAGEGAISLDDAAGVVVLSMPQAPTGPSGDAIVVQLRFEVLDDVVSGRDYLPASEIEQIETAITDAKRFVRQGDSPRAAAVLSDAFVGYLRGKDTPGSLYALLDSQDLAEPLASSLLVALDAASRPAETDVIVVALDDARRRAEATWSDYLRGLAGDSAIPVVLEARSVTDTTGAPLPVAELVPGQVRLVEGVVLATAASEAGVPTAMPVAERPTVPPALIETAAAATRMPAEPVVGGQRGEGGSEDAAHGATDEVRPAVNNQTGGGPTFPLALVVALVVAVALGLLVVALGERKTDHGGRDSQQ